jgi:phage nucleotide-binding protein
MSEVITPRYLAGLPVLKAAQAVKTVNILIYGKSGVGKTMLMGSADAVPWMRKMLVIDVEGGAMSLSHSYPNVDIVRVTDWDDVQEIYDFLYAGNHDYATVGIDSLTEMQKLNMSQVLANRIMEREAKGDTQDPDVPDMRAWGKNIEQMRRFVRAFRDLPMNCIFTALVKEDKNSRTAVIEKKPSLSGKLADEVAGFLDIVVYYYMKFFDDEQLRLLISQATDEVIAKDRTGRLPLLMGDDGVPPTMAEIVKYAITDEIPQTREETENNTEVKEITNGTE